MCVCERESVYKCVTQQSSLTSLAVISDAATQRSRTWELCERCLFPAFNFCLRIATPHTLRGWSNSNSTHSQKVVVREGEGNVSIRCVSGSDDDHMKLLLQKSH